MESLGGAEEQYRDVFMNTMVGIFRSSPDEDRYIQVNPALAHMHGFGSPEEMMLAITNIGRQLYVNPEDAVNWKKLLEKYNVIKDFETCLFRQDGSTIWVSTNCWTKRDKDGRVAYYEGIVVDISERKRIEDAVLESEERYRTAIEHSNDGVAIVCEDKFVFVNKRFLEIYGYDRVEEMLGQSPSRITHPGDKERALEFDRKRQGNESMPSVYEMRGIKRNGNTVYVEVSATNTVFRGIPASLAYIRDITERKQREKDLSESIGKITQAKQEWESLVDSLYEHVFLLDDAGRVIRSNRRIEDWGMGHMSDVKGRKLHDILHRDCVKPNCYLLDFIEEGLKELSAGRPAELEAKDEILKRHLDIRMRRIQPEKNGKERLEGSFAVLVIHDITERRRAQESLTIAHEELKETQQELILIEKLALLGKFSSGIAHEIRNPLAIIRASAQFCLNKYELDEDVKKHLRIMLRNSEHANKIIKDLIDLAKPSEVFLESGNINDVINRVCDLVKTRCEKQHVLLHKKVSRRLPPILMDEERMEKALLNFLLNALDAMPKGGKLAINAYPHFDNDEVTITILDTGKGIPSENLDKIFHPFFTTKRTGIGLGLCLADQVISSHKGKLAIHSCVGEGTAVTIKLPISRGGWERGIHGEGSDS